MKKLKNTNNIYFTLEQVEEIHKQILKEEPPKTIFPLNDFTREELRKNGWVEKEDGRFEK